MGQKGISAVGSLFSDRLLVEQVFSSDAAQPIPWPATQERGYKSKDTDLYPCVVARTLTEALVLSSLMTSFRA